MDVYDPMTQLCRHLIGVGHGVVMGSYTSIVSSGYRRLQLLLLVVVGKSVCLFVRPSVCPLSLSLSLSLWGMSRGRSGIHE